LPEEATEKEIAQVIKLAWELKCKGLTMFRNNSRVGILQMNELSECADGRCLI